MFCTKCGREQVDNPKFCRNCGEKLGLPENKKEVEETVTATSRLIAGLIGFLIGGGGIFLVALWWSGSMWQLFVSGAMAFGGLSIVWGAIKGDGMDQEQCRKS